MLGVLPLFMMGPEKKELGRSDGGRPGHGVLKLGCSGKAFLLKKGHFSWDLKGKEEAAWHRTWEDVALVEEAEWMELKVGPEEGPCGQSVGNAVRRGQETRWGWGRGWTL